MNSLTALPNDGHPSILDRVEEWNLPPKAVHILNAAMERGKITTREIAALLPVRAIKDRELFSSLITRIGNHLRSSRIRIVSSGDEAEHKEKFPLKQERKFTLVQSSEGKPLIERRTRERTKVEEVPSEQPAINEPLSEIETLETTDQYLFDVLSQYYHQISRFRLLTAEEEVKLSRRIQEEHDLEARNELVARNLRLVRWVARRYAWSGLPFEDLLQEGNLGLMIAAEKFDYRKGFRFTTYAQWWVRQAIVRGIQDTDRVIRLPVHIQELRQKVLTAAAEIAGDTQDFPSEEAIAEKLGLPVVMVRKALHVMRLDVVSLDMVLDSDGGDEGMTLGEAVADPNAANPLTVVEARQELRLACEVANVLFGVLKDRLRYSERNVRIFKALYGFDGTQEEKTLEEVGQEFGLTRERIRQIVEKIWENLKEIGVGFDNETLRQHLRRIGELEKIAYMAVDFGE